MNAVGTNTAKNQVAHPVAEPQTTASRPCHATTVPPVDSARKGVRVPDTVGHMHRNRSRTTVFPTDMDGSSPMTRPMDIAIGTVASSSGKPQTTPSRRIHSCLLTTVRPVDSAQRGVRVPDTVRHTDVNTSLAMVCPIGTCPMDNRSGVMQTMPSHQCHERPIANRRTVNLSTTILKRSTLLSNRESGAQTLHAGTNAAPRNMRRASAQR